MGFPINDDLVISILIECFENCEIEIILDIVCT